MRKTETSPASQLPKRLSPEIAEVLNMLKSLEAQPSVPVTVPPSVTR